MADSFRVVALIAAFNEGDIISPVIGHLVENGIDVYLIDNHSTDDTREQASQWLNRGLFHIETFPQSLACSDPPGCYDWTAILHRKELLARELSADWFIHHDADEIREGPWPGLNLKEAIRWVDTLGFNCINFRVLNFPPIDDGFNRGDDPRSYFIGFEDVRDFDQVQLKCWKGGKSPVCLVSSGGHEARFEGRRVCPIPFLLRHYPIRGQTHGARKVFRERKGRFIESERSQGWHIQYDQIRSEKHNFLADPATLRPFNLDRARLELMLPEKVLRDLVDRLFRTEERLDNLRRENKDLEKQLADVTCELEEIGRELNALERRHRGLEQEIMTLRNSRSWRWTAPLRRVFEMVPKSDE